MSANNNSHNGEKGKAAKRGIVVSDKMEKTIVVRIDRVVRHRFYRKVIKRSMKIKAHDEKNTAKIGDVVTIVQTRPVSKDKRWKLQAVLKKV